MSSKTGALRVAAGARSVGTGRPPADGIALDVDLDQRAPDSVVADDLDADGLDPAGPEVDDPDLDDDDPTAGQDAGLELVGLPRDRPGAATPALAVWLVIAGVLGGLAAFALSWDRVKQLENPNAKFLCSINVFVSCGSVMKTRQASEFGFPNSFMGIGGFAVVATIGVALLAGAAFRRWLWLGLQVGVVFGLGLVCWLIDQSLFHIHALCPYCMVVWSVMIPTFFVVTGYNLRSGNLGTRGIGAGRFVARHLGEILVACVVVVVGLILHEFGVSPHTYFTSN